MPGPRVPHSPPRSASPSRPYRFVSAACRASARSVGYRVDVDLASLGVSLQALIAIRLVKHDRSEIDAFRAQVPHLPGVLGVFHMAGAEDYLLHVAARDAEELRQFVLDHLTGHPAVAHTETNLIFEHVDGDGWNKLVG